jgi:hypothetical protein
MPRSDGAAAASGTQSRIVEGPLIPVLTRLPADLRRRLQQLAAARRSTVSAVVRQALETGCEEGKSGPVEGASRPSSAAQRLSVYLTAADVRRVAAYAARTGSANSSALAALLRLGLEVSDEREGIPGSRADELRDALHLIEALLCHVAPAVLGTQVLLSYAVSKTAGINVAEDEILEQCRLVGEDEWRHTLDALRQPTPVGK